MSATDELRRILDERGVPYETNDDMGASETRWNGFTAYQLTPNAKLVMHPTPEQAIAATLGNELNPDGLPEIVRCIDCEYADETESGSLRCIGYLVEKWDYYNDEPSYGRKVKSDGFCAWSKRKERIER